MLDYYFYSLFSSVIGLCEITGSASLGEGIVRPKTYSSSDGCINLGFEYFYGNSGLIPHVFQVLPFSAASPSAV